MICGSRGEGSALLVNSNKRDGSLRVFRLCRDREQLTLERKETHLPARGSRLFRQEEGVADAAYL
jgi:hypothetical protein